MLEPRERPIHSITQETLTPVHSKIQACDTNPDIQGCCSLGFSHLARRPTPLWLPGTILGVACRGLKPIRRTTIPLPSGSLPQQIGAIRGTQIQYAQCYRMMGLELNTPLNDGREEPLTKTPPRPKTLDGNARAWFDKLPPRSIDNWGDLQGKFLNKFEMLRACAKDPTKISKIVRKANESLSIFKERCASESNSIPNVLELMQILSFMSSHKWPKLAKRFLDSIPKIINEMLKRVDDYVRSEEAYRDTELSKGEFQQKEVSAQWGQRNDSP
ncbi:reverse transcriptase domain-containing protein [Tanacetum coccineum]